MNYTTNYSLPQWEASDRVTRESVNGAMAAVDTAIAGAGKWQLIKTVTLSQTGASFIADVSDIDFSQWHAIQLALNCSCMGNWTFYFSGTGVGDPYDGSFTGNASFSILLLPMGDTTLLPGGFMLRGTPTAVGGKNGTVTYAALKSIQLTGTSHNSASFYAGSTIAIYGLA